MTTTYRAATDVMFGSLLAAWNTSPFTIGGVPADLYIAGIGQPQKVDGASYWGRLTRQTVTASQTTLSNSVVKPGSKRYTEIRLVFIQLFGPRSESTAPDLIAQQAEALRNVFRRSNSQQEVWYRNARIRELPEEEKFYRTNVIAEFSYDEIF